MIDGDGPGLYLAQRGEEFHLERTGTNGVTEVVGTTSARSASRALKALQRVQLVPEGVKLRTTPDPDRWMLR